MKLKSVNLYSYDLKTKKPLYIRGKSLSHKEGLILEIINESNVAAYGEIAPLPHASLETLEEAKKQILSIKSFLVNEPIPVHAEKLEGAIANWVKNFKLYSSVSFGLEMAILNLIANSKKKPLQEILSAQSHNNVKISGLIEGSKKDVVAQAGKLIQEGYSSIKLKVNQDIDEAIADVIALAPVVEGKALLHLDANQSWDLRKGVKFGNEVGCAAVTYIEEPFAKHTDLEAFFMQTTIPAALDESLKTLNWENLGPLDGVDIFILKPTLLGGIEQVWMIKRKARSLGIETIISSSYESDLGILTLAQLSGSYTRDNYAGLDTLKYFETGILNTPLIIERGRMDISGRFVKKNDINFDRLKPADG